MEIRRKACSRRRLCLIRPLLFSTSQRWAPSVISLASSASLQRRSVEDLYLRLSLFLTATSQSPFTNRFLIIAPCRLRADGTEALRTSLQKSRPLTLWRSFGLRSIGLRRLKQSSIAWQLPASFETNSPSTQCMQVSRQQGRVSRWKSSGAPRISSPAEVSAVWMS